VLYKYIENRALTAFDNLIVAGEAIEVSRTLQGLQPSRIDATAVARELGRFFSSTTICWRNAWYFGCRIGEVPCPTKCLPEPSSISFRRAPGMELVC
jgi:hypothetical protein